MGAIEGRNEGCVLTWVTSVGVGFEGGVHVSGVS